MGISGKKFAQGGGFLKRGQAKVLISAKVGSGVEISEEKLPKGWEFADSGKKVLQGWGFCVKKSCPRGGDFVKKNCLWVGIRGCNRGRGFPEGGENFLVTGEGKYSKLAWGTNFLAEVTGEGVGGWD